MFRRGATGLAAGGGGGGRRRNDAQSSDEDEDVAYGYRIAPKRKRKYVDEHDSDDSSVANSSDDDDNDEIMRLDAARQRRRRQQQDGGGDNDEDDDDDGFVPLGLGMNKGNGKRNRGGTRTGGKAAAAASAPVFVQGSTLRLDEEDEEEEEEKGAKEEEDDDEDIFWKNDEEPETKPAVEEKEKDDPELAAQRQELQQERKEANDRFLLLLSRGKEGGGGGGRGRQRRPQQQQQQGQPRVSGGGGEASSPAAAPAADRRPVGGLGLGAATSNSSSYPGAGLGLGANSSSLPTQFGGGGLGLGLGHKSAAAGPASNLGAWEKHTKGVGSKLLAKMGYSGTGGLGKQKRGITKPVPVKVRPSGLGLGFGKFKEATSTSTIQQEEKKEAAKLKKQQQQQQRKLQRQLGVNQNSAALLPSVRDLMEDESWRRGAKKGAAGTSAKRRKRTVVPYTELLKKQEGQSYTVVDMRGPEAGSTMAATGAVSSKDQGDQTDGSKDTPVAEELMHNVSLLLNTYENKVYSSSSFTSSTKQRLASLESDVSSTKERIKQGQERTQKLQDLLKVFDDMERLSARSDEDIPVDKIQAAVRRLTYTTFPSAEERSALRFSEVIVPSLVGTFVEAKVERWNPLTDDLDLSERLIRSILSLGTAVARVEGINGDRKDEAILSMIRFLLANYLLPCIRNSLESLQWDPIRDCEKGLSFYELLLGLVQESEAGMLSDEITAEVAGEHVLPTVTEEASRPKLVDMVQEEVVHKVVYPKLVRSISQWKPQLDDNIKLVDSPGRWILPWIPHLDRHRALVPSIVSDCKRKIRSAVSFLHKNIRNDDSFVQAAVETLRPWRGVFKEKNLHDMVSSYVIPALARLLGELSANQESASTPEWGVLDLTLDMNGAGLLSDRDCLSLIEGEALACWTREVQSSLSTSPDKAASFVEAYEDWKTRILCYPLAEGSLARTRRRLAKDPVICCYFYAVLMMIRAAADSNSTALEDLRPPSETNFRVVLARRTAEDKRRSADDLIRLQSKMAGEKADLGLLEARVRLSHSTNAGQIPTFRDVVAEFAREREILFQPRLGSNASKDGKQVFLFGKIPVYFDSNVVFAFQDAEWRPVTLDDIVKRA